jgi:hypothetical protein
LKSILEAVACASVRGQPSAAFGSNTMSTSTGSILPIQPSFRSSRQDASVVPRQASESGLGVKFTSPTTRLGHLLDSVSQLGKKLPVGSHKGDLTTLPLSILASRVMYLAVLERWKYSY